MTCTAIFRPRSLRPLLAVAVLALAACGDFAATTPGGTDTLEAGKPVRVALLVPRGSDDAGRQALGQSLVDAALLAERDLAGVTLEVTVYDTAGAPGQAAEAARTAVAAGTDIFVGPLFSVAAAAVAPIAAEAGLPVLSFSNNPAIAGGNLYILGNTFANTANRVVSYTATNGFSNIAVVHPQGLEGEAARAAAVAAIQATGATLAGTESYGLSVQGIIDATPEMARNLRSSGANAVVLTDGPTAGLTFVAETLRGLGVREGAVKFAGLQRWDTSAQALAQPALDGGWFAAPDQGLTAQFAARYEAATGTAPQPVTGLAYDAIAAVGALVADATLEGRRDVFAADRLTQSAGFAGVQGVFRLRADGTTDRALAIYEVRDGAAVQVSPAPRSFSDLGS